MSMNAEKEGSLESKLSEIKSEPEVDENVVATLENQAEQQEGEGEPEKIGFDAIKEQIEKKDGEGTVKALAGASAEALKAVAADDALMKTIKSFEEKYCKLSYDYLYASVEKVDTLIQMVKDRFGVPLVREDDLSLASDNAKADFKKLKNRYKAQPWTLHGVQHLYQAYLKIPQKFLDQIRAVYTESTKSPSVSGAAHHWLGGKSTGIYHVNYDEEDADSTIDVYGYTTIGSENDGSYGLPHIDQTAAHELGHVVDHNASPMFSSTDTFRANSKWEEHADDSATLVEYMETSAFAEGKAFPTTFYDDEKYVAREVAKEILTKKIKDNDDQVDLVIDEKLIDAKNKNKFEGYQNDLKSEEVDFKTKADEVTKYNKDYASKYSNVEDKPYDFSMFSEDYKHSLAAVKILLKNHTELIHHARRSQFDGSGAWYNGELFDGMTRQIHQDDKKKWVSYDTQNAQTKRISEYQYVNPAEEFAEAFSIYYMSEDDSERASRMPAGLKAWFDTNNFNIERSRDKYKA